MTTSAILDGDETEADDRLWISTPEMCRASGATHRRIDYWVRLGLVVPAVEARGSGSQRRFEPDQVGSVRIVATLVRLGVDHDEIREAVARYESGEPLGPFEPLPGVTVDLEAVVGHAAPPTPYVRERSTPWRLYG